MPRQVARVRYWLLAAAVLAPALAACSTPEWQTAHNVRASYDDFRTGVNLTLVNRTHSDYQNLYSQPRTENNIKILADEDMRSLLQRLDELAFFEQARPAARAPSKDQLVGRMLVQMDGKELAIVMPKGLAPTPENLERAQWFRTVRAEMQQFYNDAFALQTVENSKGTPIFQQEQERLMKQGTRAGKKP